MNDDVFPSAFEACALEEFHHRDHIKIAYLYLCRHPLETAIKKVRTGLQALAVAWNAPVDDLEKGYHETMTQAWVRLVQQAMQDENSLPGADAFCDQHPHLLRKDYLDIYYSRERLMSWKAKRQYVEPDQGSFQTTRASANEDSST